MVSTIISMGINAHIPNLALTPFLNSRTHYQLKPINFYSSTIHTPSIIAIYLFNIYNVPGIMLHPLYYCYDKIFTITIIPHFTN